MCVPTSKGSAVPAVQGGMTILLTTHILALAEDLVIDFDGLGHVALRFT